MNIYEGELLNRKFDPEVEVNFETARQKCIHVQEKQVKYSIKRNYRNKRIKIQIDNDITTP